MCVFSPEPCTLQDTAEHVRRMNTPNYHPSHPLTRRLTQMSHTFSQSTITFPYAFFFSLYFLNFPSFIHIVWILFSSHEPQQATVLTEPVVNVMSQGMPPLRFEIAWSSIRWPAKTQCWSLCVVWCVCGVQKQEAKEWNAIKGNWIKEGGERRIRNMLKLKKGSLRKVCRSKNKISIYRCDITCFNRNVSSLHPNRWVVFALFSRELNVNHDGMRLFSPLTSCWSWFYVIFLHQFCLMWKISCINQMLPVLLLSL